MENNKFIKALLAFFALSVFIGIWLVFNQPSQALKQAKHSFGSIGKDKIAVVNIYGAIRAPMKTGTAFKRPDSEKLIRRLKKYREDPSVKAVVLRINSPGGSVGAVQEIYDEIIMMKQSGKKVVASFYDVAASGGYYIAAAADSIVANPGSITGSIGVIMELMNFSTLMKKIGVKTVTVKSGEHKDIGSYSREMTPEETKLLKGIIDNAYNQFLEVVMKGRNLDEATARKLADGRIFTGEQAKQSGLVDSLGGLHEAIQVATDLANIKGTPKIITDYDQFDKFFDIIPGAMEETAIDKILPDTKIRLEYIME